VASFTSGGLGFGLVILALLGLVGLKNLVFFYITDGVIRRAKLQSNRHHQQTNIQFLQAGCPSCRPTISVKVPNEDT